jgi:alkylation response protein AidB-like acyl-CoA dehydrogenase
LLQESAREFAMREVFPIANKLDPERGEIPASIRDKLAALGYFGIMIPEEYGGLGLGAFEYCLVTEELARAWMSVGTIIRNGLVNTLVPMSVFNEEQRRKYFHRMHSHCPNPPRFPTSPPSPAAPSATATTGSSAAINIGVPSPTPPTSSS